MYQTGTFSARLARMDAAAGNIREFARRSSTLVRAAAVSVPVLVGLRAQCFRFVTELSLVTKDLGEKDDEFAAYVKVEKAVGVFDLAESLTDIVATLNAVRAAIESVVPIDADGFVLAYRWSDASIEDRTLSVDECSSVAKALDGVAAGIE